MSMSVSVAVDDELSIAQGLKARLVSLESRILVLLPGSPAAAMLATLRRRMVDGIILRTNSG